MQERDAIGRMFPQTLLNNRMKAKTTAMNSKRTLCQQNSRNQSQIMDEIGEFSPDKKQHGKTFGATSNMAQSPDAF